MRESVYGTSGGGFDGRFWVLAPAVDNSEALSDPSKEGALPRATRGRVLVRRSACSCVRRSSGALSGLSAERRLRQGAAAHGAWLGGGSGERIRWHRSLPRARRRASGAGLGDGWGPSVAQATTHTDLVVHGVAPGQGTPSCPSPASVEAARHVPSLDSEVGFPPAPLAPGGGAVLGPGPI
jgi:hypothetical protein